MTVGVFITFEGPEGSGKTTQIAALKTWLGTQALDVLITREPGGTDIGGRVRSILLDPVATEMQPRTEVLLFSAARAQLVDQVIRPHLAQGAVVICDRYADSTMAYQGYGHGLDRGMLSLITAFATGGLVPDLTVFLDIAVETGLLRKQQDDLSQWNRMERKSLAYHQRVRSGYLEMASAEPGRWLVLDATQPFDVVQRAVRRRVAAVLGLAPQVTS
jgi:dTMP kinase